MELLLNPAKFLWTTQCSWNLEACDDTKLDRRKLSLWYGEDSWESQISKCLVALGSLNLRVSNTMNEKVLVGGGSACRFSELAFSKGKGCGA
jgi:hypothetical protein